MSRFAIVCVEDDRAVLDALVRDLAPFAGVFQIEAAETAEEARGLVDELLRAKISIALVLADHILPEASGVDLLVELNKRPETAEARKVLVTAQAGLQDTVKAVNDADLDHYIAKPWSVEGLHAVVRKQLTEYVVGHAEDLIPYLKVLEDERLLEVIHARGTDRVI
jgi:two-component system, OmpR family, phosphate regulon response regulator PhoB